MVFGVQQQQTLAPRVPPSIILPLMPHAQSKRGGRPKKDRVHVQITPLVHTPPSSPFRPDVAVLKGKPKAVPACDDLPCAARDSNQRLVHLVVRPRACPTSVPRESRTRGAMQKSGWRARGDEARRWQRSTCYREGAVQSITTARKRAGHARAP